MQATSTGFKRKPAKRILSPVPPWRILPFPPTPPLPRKKQDTRLRYPQHDSLHQPDSLRLFFRFCLLFPSINFHIALLRPVRDQRKQIRKTHRSAVDRSCLCTVHPLRRFIRDSPSGIWLCSGRSATTPDKEVQKRLSAQTWFPETQQTAGTHF